MVLVLVFVVLGLFFSLSSSSGSPLRLSPSKPPLRTTKTSTGTIIDRLRVGALHTTPEIRGCVWEVLGVFVGNGWGRFWDMFDKLGVDLRAV